MTIDEFITQIEDKSPLAPPEELARFEARIGAALPEDYRDFLVRCNGGYVGGRYWFQGLNPEGHEVEAGVHHVGGLREKSSLSLTKALDNFKDLLPEGMIWIHDDPFGNAICLGLAGEMRGRLYFWDHESFPEDRDGTFATASNVTLLADSFTGYVAGLQELEDA